VKKDALIESGNPQWKDLADDIRDSSTPALRVSAQNDKNTVNGKSTADGKSAANDKRAGNDEKDL
jgi:hypothetical protein